MKVVQLVVDNREAFKDYSHPTPYFGTAPEALFSGFSYHDEIEVHIVSCTQSHMESPRRLADNIWFHSLHVPKMGWLRSAYYGCIKAVKRKIAEIGPDLVHAQGTERDCAISAVFLPYPKILTIHGNLRLIGRSIGFKPFSAMWFQTFLEGLVVPRFDGIVCITNYTKAQVQHETHRTWVVPNAVDSSFFDIHQTPSPTPIVLCVANIEMRKNQNAFIRALEPLAQSRSFEVRFYGSIGVGKYAEDFRALVDDKPWCKYGGRLNRDELRKQFSEATILALPTKEDNCPMVVLEAMASGVPVVAADVGGIPDLIRNNETGIFCDPENADSMRKAVGKLLDSAELRIRLAAEARADALERFHPEKIAEQHIEIYRSLLTSKVLSI